MSRGAKIAVGLFLTPIFILVFAIFGLLLFDWNWIKGQLAEAIGASINRDVSIGRIDVEWGWTTWIRAEDIEIGNAEWAVADRMADIGSLDITVELSPLIRGRIVLPSVAVGDPVLAFERDGSGAVNWSFAGPGDEIAGAVTPDERDEFPTVGQLMVSDGRVSYRDAIRDMNLTGQISTATGEAAESDGLTLSLDGSLAGRDVSVAFRGGSLAHLRESDRPYPVSLRIAAGATQLEVEGTAVEPLAVRQLDARFQIEGATMAEIYLITGIPLPDTPPYALSGRLAREGAVWRLTAFDGRVGDSDLSGEASIDPSGKRPRLQGDLVSRRLDFDDLAGFIGAEPDPDESANEAQRAAADDESQGVFPDTPVDTERMHAMDMDVRFSGREILAPGLPLEELEAHLVLEDGRAVIDPLNLSVAQGRIDAALILDARPSVPAAELAATFEELNLKPFFTDTEFVNEMGGRFFGDLKLNGQGASLAEMLAAANGSGWLGMRDGTISGLLVEAAGVDVIEALAVLVTEDARIPIRCGRAEIEANAGAVTAQRVIVDTSDSILLARGNADLNGQSMDLQIEARPKDFSLIDMAAPVHVHGPFRNPSVGLGGLDPLPFLELGEAEDVDCSALLAGEPVYVAPDSRM